MTEFPEADEFNLMNGREPVPEDDGMDDQSAVERMLVHAGSLQPTNRTRAAREAAEAALETTAVTTTATQQQQQQQSQRGIREVTTRVIPVLKELCRDTDANVRSAAAMAMADVTEALLNVGGANPSTAQSDRDAARAAVTAQILPALRTMASDRSQQSSRQAALDAIAAVGALLQTEDAAAHVAPIITALAADVDEEVRADSLALLNSVSATLGTQACISFAVPLIVRLADDPVFRVRKAVAANMASVSNVIGPKGTSDSLLPVFLKLSSDQIWSVRKACAEALVGVASNTCMDVRMASLVPVVSRHLEDQSRWVRGAAFQALGPFLCLLEPSGVPSSLVRSYTDMANENVVQKLGDSDIRHFCAFSFPGVLQTLGRSRWPELMGTFATLSNDLQWKVRRTLAFSLHEVAAIVGGDVAERDLVPAFELFFRDIDDVRVGVIANFARFIAGLRADARERFLPVATDLLIDPNWRIRKLLARQLGTLVMAYETPATREFLQDATLQLLNDPVSSVRRVAASAVGEVFKAVPVRSQAEFAQKVVAFSKGECHTSRHLFLYMCSSLVLDQPPSDFVQQFLPHALGLRNDKVPNVRAALARFLTGQLLQLDPYSSMADVRAAVKDLSKDKDHEVSGIVNELSPIPVSELDGGTPN